MRNIFLTALAIFFRNLCFLRSYCSRYLVLCKAVKTNIYISFSKHCLEFWSDVTKMYFYYEIIKVNKMHVDPWFLNPTYCPSPNCIPLVNTSLINKFLVTDFFYFSIRHIRRILAKFHGFIITTFETINFFRRTVLTKWRFYVQNTVKVSNTWNSCRMWTSWNIYLKLCQDLSLQVYKKFFLSIVLHHFQTIEQ